MTQQDTIKNKIINRFDIGVETFDISTFISIMKNVGTMSYLVNQHAGTEIDMVIQKAITNLNKESSMIPQETPMSDAIREKSQWIQYAGKIETNFHDYVIRQIRRILVDNLVV